MATAADCYKTMDLKSLLTLRKALESDLKYATSDESRDFIIGRLYTVNWFITQLLSEKGGNT